MAYSPDDIETARASFELGKSLREISSSLDIALTTVQRWSKENNWEKQKTEHIKSDIIDFEEKTERLEVKKRTLLDVISGLAPADIELLDREIFNETKRKSTLFNIVTLSMIRKQQLLMKNAKSVVVKNKIYDLEGRVCGEEVTLLEVPLEPSDLKNIDDAIDKNSLTLKINERHAKTDNTVGVFQAVSEVRLIDA